MMKRILLVAAIALCGIAAQAQNKVFEKYAKMEGVEYVCINKAMFSAGLSLATAGQVVFDSIDTKGTDLEKFAKFNRMIIITAKGDKKQQLSKDIQKLSKEKGYEILMESQRKAMKSLWSRTPTATMMRYFCLPIQSLSSAIPAKKIAR